MFSEIKEESIHNTTRNFYNKYMGQDESNIEWHHNEGQSDLGKHRQFQTIKSGFNPLSSKNGTGYQDGQRNGIVYSFGNNEEGTSAAFLQKLKATETSKYNTNYQANSTNYLNENKKYSANDIGEGTTNNYASTFNYVSTVSSP